MRKIRAKPPRAVYAHHLDTPLIKLSRHDRFTVRDACAGVHIFGANGSGKTSGSGRTLAKAYLSAGFGGLVLCAKPSERALWQAYAKEANRTADLVILSPEQPWRFNFLDYELKRVSHHPASKVENLLSTLMTVLEQSGREFSGEDSQFWIQAAELVLRNALLVLAAAQPNFTLFDLQRFIDAAPKAANAQDERSRGFSRMLETANEAFAHQGQLADYEVLKHYWTEQYPYLPDKTRGSVLFTLNTMLQDLQTGTLRELFGTTSNIFPDDTHEGAVIILDLPAVQSRTYRMAQTLFKTVWQQATLRRSVIPKTRPVFLWADESHLFVSPHDTDFQSLARDRKACTVYLTQNLSAYHQRLPAKNAQAMTAALLGYFQTQMFHALSDPTTIQHAQFLFGKRDRVRTNYNTSDAYGTSNTSGSNSGWQSSSSKDGGSFGSNFGSSFSNSRSTTRTRGLATQHAIEDALRPEDFTSLMAGGPANGFCVSAFCFRTGGVWRHGSTCLYTLFDQRL